MSGERGKQKHHVNGSSVCMAFFRFFIRMNDFISAFAEHAAVTKATISGVWGIIINKRFHKFTNCKLAEVDIACR